MFGVVAMVQIRSVFADFSLFFAVQRSCVPVSISCCAVFCFELLPCIGVGCWVYVCLFVSTLYSRHKKAHIHPFL